MNQKLLLALLIFICGCKPSPKYITKEEVYKVAFSNPDEVEQIRSAIYDSMAVWKKEKVKGYNMAPSVKEKIDTIICFNAEKDKLITCRLNSIKGNYPFDNIGFFYGVKVNSKWYFFDGPSLVIGRKDEKIPNTFTQLSNMAYQEVFSGYLKRNKEGKLEINDDFFADLTSGAWYNGTPYPHDKETWDKRYIEIVSEARAKIDTNDYSKMR